LLINLPSPHPRILTRPSTFEALRAKEHTPTLSPCVVFIFGLTVECIKEFGGASKPILKINYPHGIYNMASKKLSGELPNQGLGSPYKTNNEHYFYYRQPFQQEFFTSFYM
jgi:hypothetical protein